MSTFASPATATRPLARLVLMASSLLLADSANAVVVSTGNGDVNAAQYYGSQAYSEIKNASGNVLAESGRFVSGFNPVGVANESGSLSASGSGLSFSANARLDGFALARAAVTASVSNTVADFGYNVVASQASRTQALFSAATTPGRVVFNFALTGSESTPYGLALGRLDFLARAFQPGAGSYFDVYGSDALHAVGAGNYSFTYTGATSQPLDILFYAAAGVITQERQVPGNTSFTAFANFANTFDLDSIDLFDANGDAITDWTLTDQATQRVVFTQDGRVVTAPIPEPSTFLLMGLGLVGLGFARRRR